MTYPWKGPGVFDQPPSTLVTTDTAQTISGVKTFSSSPVVPDGSFGVAKLSATGTRSGSTYLRGDGVWSTVSASAPSNMVTTDTNQTITGQKTMDGNFTTKEVYVRRFSPFGASPSAGIYFQFDPDGASAGYRELKTNSDGELETNGTFKATAVYDSGDRVYSPSNPPPPPSDAVTTNTEQTITANKTFSGELTSGSTATGYWIFNGSGQLSGVAAPSTSGQPTKSVSLRLFSSIWSGSNSFAFADLIAEHDSSVLRLRSTVPLYATSLYDNNNRVYSVGNKVPVSGMSATGTASSTTFLRGDNTWATPTAEAPSNMVTTDTQQTITEQKTISVSPGGDAITMIPNVLALSNATTRWSPQMKFTTYRWDGSSSASETITVQAIRSSASAGAYYLWCNGPLRASELYDNDSRVYTALNPPPAAANMVTTDTTQTISGVKTFSSGRALFTQATEPASPAANNVALFAVNDGSGVARVRVKHSDGTVSAIRAIEPYVMAVTGTLTVTTGKSRIYLRDNYVVESIQAAANTAPTGAAVVVDVNKNGTSIYTNQANRPTIAVSTNASTAFTPDITTFASGDYITVDVDQIGSTVAGSDLTVTIRLRRV